MDVKVESTKPVIVCVLVITVELVTLVSLVVKAVEVERIVWRSVEVHTTVEVNVS